VYYYREDVSGTLRKDAAVGQEWEVLVSGRVVPVRLQALEVKAASSFCKRARRRFLGTNVQTGREITGDCARLRRRVK
jgi:hypothetical protein